MLGTPMFASMFLVRLLRLTALAGSPTSFFLHIFKIYEDENWNFYVWSDLTSFFSFLMNFRESLQAIYHFLFLRRLTSGLSLFKRSRRMRQGKQCENQSNKNSYLAQCNAGIQTVHKVVDINQELGIERVEPLGQVLPHRIQILLAWFERAIRTSFQQHRSHCSTVWLLVALWKIEVASMWSQSKIFCFFFCFRFS